MIDYRPRKDYISYRESRLIEKDLLLAFLSSLGMLLLGTLGYAAVEGWSLLDSLYMSIITLTTVGFMEVHPLSEAGKIFTIVYIFVGVVNVAYLFSLVGRAIVQGEVGHIRYWRRMKREISEMENHFIICGFGRFTRALCEKLGDEHQVVIIEKNPTAVKNALKQGYNVIEGDATEDECLMGAGVKRASKIFALLPVDSENMFITLGAKEANPKIEVKARAENPRSVRKLIRSGADLVISPYEVAAEKLSKMDAA